MSKNNADCRDKILARLQPKKSRLNTINNQLAELRGSPDLTRKLKCERVSLIDEVDLLEKKLKKIKVAEAEADDSANQAAPPLMAVGTKTQSSSWGVSPKGSDFNVTPAAASA